MPGLDVLRENRFALGTWRSGAADLEPEGSAYNIVGLLGDDGLPQKRGGSTYKSNAAVGSTGLLWVWSGNLVPGERTVFANATEVDALGADDATPATLASATGAPERVALVGGVAALGTTGLLYGGGRKADYSTGTVQAFVDSADVTGTGTSWTANVDAGMLFTVAGYATFVVRSVNSNTSLTLDRPWEGGNIAGSAYALERTRLLSGYSPTRVGRIVASVANRLVWAVDTAVYFSPTLSPAGSIATDRHSFPAQVKGLGTLRDVLLVFTSAGLWAVSNMAYDLTDALGNPQHRKEVVNADLIAWGHEGIAPWGGSLIVPALDDVWMMDTLGAPIPVGGRIRDLYLSYVRAGHKAGVAEVFAGHYLLPILTSANVWVDSLVCKLTPSHDDVRNSWTQLSGQGAEVAGFAERTSSPPLLLAASRKTTSRVLDVTGFFNPSATVKNDADSTAPTFQLTTRNIPTGGMVVNSVQFIQLSYTLTDSASDDPSFTAEVSVDGGAWQLLSGEAPEGSPGTPYTWPCQVAARHVRFRFTSTAASAALKIESLKIHLRKSGLYL